MDVIATVYHQTGMHWGTFVPEDLDQQEWGTITLDFTDCNNMSVIYTATHNIDGIPSGEGIIPMVRLASIDQTQCQETRAANIYRGYLETDDGEDESYGATFLMAGDGRFVAWVDDYFAAFGGFGLGVQTDAHQFDDGLQLVLFAHDGNNAFALSIDRF